MKFQAQDQSSKGLAGFLQNVTDDGFDYKSILLWLFVGVFVVFGAVKVLKMLLNKSEKKSEEWRERHRVSFYLEKKNKL